jgi:hypothetical protein
MSPGHTKVPDENCVALREVLNRVGDKWSIQVVALLNRGPERFSAWWAEKNRFEIQGRARPLRPDRGRGAPDAPLDVTPMIARQRI